MNDHDPYAYLKDVLARLPVRPAARLDELLPGAGNQNRPNHRMGSPDAHEAPARTSGCKSKIGWIGARGIRGAAADDDGRPFMPPASFQSRLNAGRQAQIGFADTRAVGIAVE